MAETTIVSNASECPVEVADRLGQLALASHDEDSRSKRGQFFTPPQLARFLAQFVGPQPERVRLLDPGAGSGVLACAAAEQLIASGRTRTLEIVAYENDPRLLPALSDTLEYLGRWLRQYDVSLVCDVRDTDFTLSCGDGGTSGLFADERHAFDIAIANPPYSKVSSSHHVAKNAALMGSSNMYAAFMLAACNQLSEHGTLIFITPRSYTSGAYFRTFRHRLFTQMKPTSFHLFGSRVEAFGRDQIMQESLVIVARKQSGWLATGDGADWTVQVSSSRGIDDLPNSRSHEVPMNLVLHRQDRELFLRLPTSDSEDAVLRQVDNWPNTLHSLGLEVSTGRVVPFRAAMHLHSEPGEKPFSPLIWMQHIQPMTVAWPIRFRKQQYMDDTLETQPLLVPDSNYVLLRRFSSKEQPRRLTAAPLCQGHLGTSKVGIENHVNYIWARQGHLTQEMARGLALLLNSELLDTYFRILNGNTEVSATEVRTLPLPAEKDIRQLGHSAEEVDVTGVGARLDR